MTSPPDLAAKPYSEKELIAWRDDYRAVGDRPVARWLATVDALRSEHAATVARLERECAGAADQWTATLQKLAERDAEHKATVAIRDHYAAACESYRAHIDQVEQYLTERDAEVRRLREAMGLDRPWPLPDVLRKLASAADHLLRRHDYDGHGWEEIGRARDEANRISDALSPPASPPQAEAKVEHKCEQCGRKVELRGMLCMRCATRDEPQGAEAPERRTFFHSAEHPELIHDSRTFPQWRPIDYLRADLADEAVRLLRKTANALEQHRPTGVHELTLSDARAFLARLDAGNKP